MWNRRLPSMRESHCCWPSAYLEMVFHDRLLEYINRLFINARPCSGGRVTYNTRRYSLQSAKEVPTLLPSYLPDIFINLQQHLVVSEVVVPLALWVGVERLRDWKKVRKTELKLMYGKIRWKFLWISRDNPAVCIRVGNWSILGGVKKEGEEELTWSSMVTSSLERPRLALAMPGWMIISFRNWEYTSLWPTNKYHNLYVCG